MANTLLRSGDIKDFKILGHDGKAAYLVAAQIREMFRVKLGKQYADYLAIPQRNDHGNIIDWYIPFDSNQPDGQYDIVPWTSASESEQQSALVLLKEFEHKVMNFGKQLASHPNLEGDQLLFSRLIYDPKNNVDSAEPNLMAIRFPSNQFVYIVNGKPVITFWGFVYPHTSQANSPFYSLEALEKVAQAATITSVQTPINNRAWWKRWWIWLLGLLPLLLLLLALFLLRGCWLKPEISINPNVSLDNSNINQPEKDDKQDKKATEPELKTEPRDVVVDNRLGVTGNAIPNGTILDNTTSTPTNPDVASDSVDYSVAPNNANEGNNTSNPDAQDNKNDQVTPPDIGKTDDKDEKSMPNDLDKKDNKANSNAAVDQTNNLALPADAIKQGSTKFLDGQWSANGGIQDKATGKPLQLSYNFKDGNGEVTITRSDGVKCTGNVGTDIKNTNLGIAGNTEAVCSDNTKYQLPKIQCTPGKDNKANCQGIYNNGTSFPITMKKQ
ncbi:MULTISPECIES: SrfA family protein [unclassified Gilliamella]|uniref:SrfA family protein n=1 Tax=unclassified Gilliamella TaxID=2685620 RepID=UPI00080EA3FE|nr:SrfA family protein [Gilliamella apicola]OCG20344.1 hypothetical protein A9G23_05795 [Gilliamella apicola]OCG22718.1 hypothetical protein A9G22_06845 [Gilliamella apicola]